MADLMGDQELQREFSLTKKAERMWARVYFSCGTGNITDKMIKDYTENHGEQDDGFHVE